MVGVGALKQRHCIHRDAVLKRAAPFDEHCGETDEAGAQNVVIINAPGVAGNGGIGRESRSIVELPHANEGPGSGKQAPGIFAHGAAVVCQIAHFAVQAASDPVLVVRKLIHWSGGRDACELKPAGPR